MWFQLGLNKTFCPTSTIIHQRFKHHQREKLTKIHFLPPPHWFSTQSSQYQYWTANKVFHPDGNRTWTISRSSQLLKTLCHCPPPPHTSLKKHCSFCLFAVSVKMKTKNIKEELIEILTILGSTENIQLLEKYDWRKPKPRIKIEKYMSKKKWSPKRNKANWIDQYKVQIGLYNSKLHWTLFFTFLHGDYWPPCSFFHMKIKFSWRWQITSKYNNKKFLAW